MIQIKVGQHSYQTTKEGNGGSKSSKAYCPSDTFREAGGKMGRTDQDVARDAQVLNSRS